MQQKYLGINQLFPVVGIVLYKDSLERLLIELRIQVMKESYLSQGAAMSTHYDVMVLPIRTNKVPVQ